MAKRRGFDFWQALIWLGAIIILSWALLKSFGIIHSPIWVEMVPYLGIGISILGVAYKFGKMANDVEYTRNKVNVFSKDFLELREDFSKVKHNQMLCLSGELGSSPYKRRF